MHNGESFRDVFNPSRAYAITKAIGGNVRQVKQALQNLLDNDELIVVLNNINSSLVSNDTRCQMTVLNDTSKVVSNDTKEVSYNTSEVSYNTKYVSNDTTPHDNNNIYNNIDNNNINNTDNNNRQDNNRQDTSCYYPTFHRYNKNEEMFLRAFGKRPRTQEDILEFHEAFKQATEEVSVELLVECATLAVEALRAKDGDTRYLRRPNVWLADRTYQDFINKAKAKVKERKAYTFAPITLPTVGGGYEPTQEEARAYIESRNRYWEQQMAQRKEQAQ
jgi:hypothetical protein